MMNANTNGRAGAQEPVTGRPEPREPRVEPRTPSSRASEPRAQEPRAAAEVRAPESAVRASVLGPTLRFRGELSAQEDLIVQGSVEGSITHTQSLTIGTDGAMKGDIRARVPVGDHAAGLVDELHDDSAMDVAGGIGILRRHHLRHDDAAVSDPLASFAELTHGRHSLPRPTASKV